MPKIENQKQKKEKKAFFWEEMIHKISEFYRVDWDEILNWNYYKFIHRLKFVNFTIEKKSVKK